MSTSALESPNIIEGREVIRGLADQKFIDARKELWGEGSPAYQARVLGQFPDEGENTLVPLSWVEAKLNKGPEKKRDESRLQMGVDVARAGGDRTVLLIRNDQTILHLSIKKKQDTMATAGQVLALGKQFNISPKDIMIDDIGVGGGVVDRLKEQRWHVKGINVSRPAKHKDRFANTRAEAYWNLREALSPQNTEFSIPHKYKDVGYECTLIQYDYTSKGQIKIEDKDQIRQRGGRSPDLADALALTFIHKRRTVKARWL